MKRTRILLQTTIPETEDDWSIARFSALADFLRWQENAEGMRIFDVITRDRDPLGAPDSLLSKLDRSDFDQMWLFAVDTGNGLTDEDCAGISRFRRAGRGLLHLDPDISKREVDDPYTTHISWPNFHSGANGDYQTIDVVGPVHPVLADPSSPTGAIRYLPAHPHEGAVGAPQDEPARVIATGTSAVTGRRFNLAVAFEPGPAGGPAIAQSTFHHFADYNWDTDAGAPSFVDEPPGCTMTRLPQAMADTHRYVRNVALWLAQAGGRLTD
jgi:hypothetical protein